VAIKPLPDESLGDPDAVARFEREAKALSRVSHPGIVQVFDYGEASGRYYLVMEYSSGMSLSELVRQNVAVPTQRAADCIRQAATALQHPHERGLVHRDLKPGNLLVDVDGQVKSSTLDSPDSCKTSWETRL